MHIFTGRICIFLRNSADEVNGLALDGGVAVHFSCTALNRVLEIATIGSLIEVHARQYGSESGKYWMRANFITNLESNWSVILHVPTTPRSPEVSVGVAPLPPAVAAPLAPCHKDVSESQCVERAVPQPYASRKNVAEKTEKPYVSNAQQTF